jgi:hydrogenase maturation protein HypF
LEAAASRHVAGARTPRLTYASTERDGMLWIDWGSSFADLLERGVMAPEEAGGWAYAAHEGIAQAAGEMVNYALERTGCRILSLSGGVFMNRILNDLLVPRLEFLGLKVLLHRKTPPNDGCIAMGQAIVAGCEA